jgi:hypothetical protein
VHLKAPARALNPPLLLLIPLHYLRLLVRMLLLRAQCRMERQFSVVLFAGMYLASEGRSAHHARCTA